MSPAVCASQLPGLDAVAMRLQVLLGDHVDQLLSHVCLIATLWTVARQVLWDLQDKDIGVGCHFLLQGGGHRQSLNSTRFLLLQYRRVWGSSFAFYFVLEHS